MKEIHYTQGIDTYLVEGKVTQTLAIKTEERRAYFAKNTEVHKLLLREEQNPLVEEGAISAEQRDHLGEFYLTYEALTLLIEKKIRHPKKSASNLNYNIKNLFVIKNNFETLRNILLNVDLLDGVDAKIIYITKIHAVSFYLRNEGGKLKCFIIDSEAGVYGPPEELITIIQSIYPGVEVYLSNTTLQKDYYSCSTFAYKAILYFVKHGDEVFPWLEKHCIRDEDSFILPENKLMPRLLKLCQSKIQLSDEILNSVVSHKPQLTLREYYENKSVTCNGKTFNSAALLKKYLYFTALNDYIVAHSNNEEISCEIGDDLPRGLNGRHLFYSRIPRVPSKANKINVIDIYLGIIDINENRINEETNPACFDALNQIQKRFPSFVKEYQKRNSVAESEQSDYDRIEMLFFVAACAEIKDFSHVALYSGFAKKLDDIFGDFSKVVQFLKKYIKTGTRQPVHDLCVFTPPRSHHWDKAYWAKLVMDFGEPATKLLALAPQIDKLLKSSNADLKNKQFNNELEKIQYIQEKFNYSRANENQELNKLCRQHVLSEKDFESTLEIVNFKLKHFDLLPDITVTGSELDDPKLNNYRMVKLPIRDLRGFFLGEYSGCCQSVGKQGASCAIHGMTSEWGGFYVVFNAKNEIISQLWAWIGTKRQFVFDSFEFEQSKKSFLFKPFIRKAAEIIIQYGFSSVLIGNGGRTPNVGFKLAEQSAEHPEKGIYSDAHKQYLIRGEDTWDLKAKFENYAKQVALRPELFNSIFEQSSVKHLQFVLTELISRGQLSFTDFLKILQFFYPQKKDFLHRRSAQGVNLLLKAYQSYESKMDQFINFKNHKKLIIIEAVLQNDNLELINLLLKYMNPHMKAQLLSESSDKIDRLSHMAAKNNASKIYWYLHRTFYSKISWDDFVSLPDAQGMSALYVAAIHKHFELMVDISISFDNCDKLVTLLNKSLKPADLAPFHHLVSESQDIPLQKLERFLSGAHFCKLLDNEIELNDGYKPTTRPSVFLALTKGSVKVANYLLENYYQAESIKRILTMRFENRSLLGYAAQTNNFRLMRLLRNYSDNKAQWIEQLNQPTGYYGLNVLAYAFYERAWQSALTILRSLNDFEPLHQLIVTNSTAGVSVLNRLHDSPSKILSRVLKYLIKTYAKHLNEFKEILLEEDRSFIKSVIKQENVVLFELLLKVIVSDQTFFIELLLGEDYKPTLLECIIKTLDFRATWLKERPSCLFIKRQFIDCLFRYCSPDQIKIELSNTRYLCLITNVTLEHVLSVVGHIDDGEYVKTWLTLNRRSQLETVFCNWVNSSSVTEVMLEFAVIHYGITAVHNFVLAHVKPMFHPIVSFNNDALFHFIYPVICSIPKKVQKLLCDMISNFRQDGFSMSSFIYFLQQPEFSVDMLKECMSVKRRTDPFGFCPEYNLQFIRVVWNACVTRMTMEEQRDVISMNVYDLIYCICKRAVYVDEKSRNALQPSIELVHQWMVELNRNNELLTVLNALTPDKRTFFDAACDTDNALFVKSLLLACSDEQRKQLVATFKPLESKNQIRKPTLDLPKLLVQCERINRLLYVKGQINSSFFQPVFVDKASLRIQMQDVTLRNCLLLESVESSNFVLT